MVKHTRLFHVEFCLIRIIGPLLKIIRMVAVYRGNGMIIATSPYPLRMVFSISSRLMASFKAMRTLLSE